ncbi:hypothetical protein E1295_28625 [Nonomuraea mesophila]|uniref:DUF4097 domain-containing protein n=1 Tax=Nonomuraea mesophila TaxID=2530382 RepID=A0A4R5F383_9ACTN|nr:DUF4097 family beta strand repeat-containing protein [Nonomuraea mesophila]TDE41953.1 hypothetical protein E1295_28625 [Nonomuraea mesophila]
MRTMAIAGGLLASALALTGCGLANIGGPTEQDTASYQVTDKVTKLRLESSAGDTVVTETGGDAIRVTETLRWRGDDKPTPEHKVEGEELFVTYDCPSSFGSCRVDYKIEIPKGLAVDLEAGSGNMTLRDLTGTIDVKLGSGDVDAAGLGGKKVYADAGSGDIELKYRSAPAEARLKTGSGNTKLVVPAGKYAVSTDVGSGDVNVKVDNDGSSPNKISVSAGSGDVSVEPG